MLKRFNRCSYCGREHEIKRGQCQASRKICSNYLKNNHFQVVCKFKKKTVERVEENETNMQVFSAKKQRTKTRMLKKLEKRHYPKD